MSHIRICHQLRQISTSVYKFTTWYHVCQVPEYGHATVTGGMKIIEKITQEPGILSLFALIVRWQNRKSIYQSKRSCKLMFQ